jgi:hypothetical protein
MDKIKISKLVKDKMKDAQTNSKLDYCLCCKKKVSSFCNSHSLPKFILKNISDNGYVLNSNHFFKIQFIDEAYGLNKSGTFKRICNECDNTIFKLYESEDCIETKPRKKMMTVIDLKNSLRMIDKRLTEISLYDSYINSDYPFNDILYQQQLINKLDLNEYENELTRDLNILKKKSTSSFELIYWEIVDYVTPIAFQGHVALIGDLEGNIINDVYYKNPKYVIENLNICVFPLKSKTVIMMFNSNDNKKYKNFIKQFKKLSREKKLHLISYIIINYSEDFFISKNAESELLENKLIEEVAKNTTNFFSLDQEYSKAIKREKTNELKKYDLFPNLLSAEYSLKENQ